MTTSLRSGPSWSSAAVPHAELARRFTRRVGPFQVHLGSALLSLDLLACAFTVIAVGSLEVLFVMQAACTLFGFALLHLYRRRLSLALLNDLPYMAGAVAVGYMVVLPVLQALSSRPFSSTLLPTAALLLALVVSRWLCFTIVKQVRCAGGLRDQALIVGAGHVGIRLGESLNQHRELGVATAGYIDSSPRLADGQRLPAPLVGNYDELATVIEDCNVAYVMVAFGSVREESLVDILRTCDRMEVDVFIVPRLFELHNTSRDTDDVWGIPLVRVRRAAFRSPWWKVKRLIDVLAAAVALILLAGVLFACALAVRLEGGPGVIFRQERVGLDGRPFQLLKFRSLKPVDDGESRTQWNIAHDDRLGPAGRFLRQSSLDELPQLWNILRGDMSLVGPRPERPHFVEHFAHHIPRYAARHRVPAGLTGWAQVHGLRGDTSIEHRARFDNYYIENWSLWLDVKIVVRTLGQVLRRSGG